MINNHDPFSVDYWHEPVLTNQNIHTTNSIQFTHGYTGITWLVMIDHGEARPKRQEPWYFHWLVDVSNLESELHMLWG